MSKFPKQKPPPPSPGRHWRHYLAGGGFLLWRNYLAGGGMFTVAVIPRRANRFGTVAGPNCGLIHDVPLDIPIFWVLPGSEVLMRNGVECEN